MTPPAAAPPLKPTPACPDLEIDAAVAQLGDGGVLACPTEGVWGLACDARCEVAVRRVLALKARDAAKGLILIGESRSALQPLLAPLEPAWRSRMDSAWPGPVTFIVPCARSVPDWLTGGRLTLAVRVSAHPVLAALVAGLGRPIVSTSANRSGERPLPSPAAIRRAFAQDLDGIVTGELGGRRKPSAIIDVRTGRQWR